jgi:CPA2 family monovalent cation:H+ antiporter-2
MRGFFRGASDADSELDQHAQPRLHTVLITQGAAAAGQRLDALMLLGVPLTQVLKRIRDVRESRYAIMRGFFRGASDADSELDQHAQPRLHTVLVTQGAAAAGQRLDTLMLDELRVDVVAIRRQGIKGVDPQPDTEIRVGDVLVMRGAADGLAAAEFRVQQG